MIEASLTSDMQSDKAIDRQVRYLKDKVTDVYSALREGLNPNYTSANVALTAIEGSLRRRTFGPDGWPLA
jgi:hypothetical protein